MAEQGVSEHTPLIHKHLPEPGLLGECHAVRKRRQGFLKLAAVIIPTLLAGCLVLYIAFTGSEKEIGPLIRVADLPPEDQLVAGRDNRLIVVGDVHGMYNEFAKLLQKVKADPAKDRIILVGDFITKGPDSTKVIDLAIKYNAACVRGNHENEILQQYVKKHKAKPLRTYPAYASQRTVVFGQKPTATLKPTPDTRSIENAEPVLPTSDADVLFTNCSLHDFDDAKEKLEGLIASMDIFAKTKYANDRQQSDKKLVKNLKPHHLRYLEKCPAILHMGQVSKQGIEAIACHGGLLWNVEHLEEQDPEVVMTIRTIQSPDFSIPSEDNDGTAWFEGWACSQRNRDKRHRFEVFYGHDASRGLQIHKYSKGLDSRCQKGGFLSALVITVDEQGHYHQTLETVDC